MYPKTCKFSSCLQRLKQSYLLTYQQKEWTYRTKKALVLSSKGSFIYRLLSVQYILLSHLYKYMFVCKRAILPCCIFGLWLSVCVPLSPDRGLPLSNNSVLHVWPQLSTEHPPPFIVGLIWSPQYFSLHWSNIVLLIYQLHIHHLVLNDQVPLLFFPLQHK